MNELFRFHHDLGYATIAVNLCAGIWMFIGLKNNTIRRHKHFLTPVYVGWATIVLQVFLGVSLYMSGYHVANNKGFHYFYGFLLFGIATVIWSYRNSLPADKKILIYGASSLFMSAMALRSALLVLL